MYTYNIILNEEEEKVLRFLVPDPQAWLENLVSARIKRGRQEIINYEIENMLSDPDIDSIPGDPAVIIANSKVLPAADRKKKDKDKNAGK